MAASPVVTIDLLTQAPTSNDPATWARPSWPNYTPATARVRILTNQLPGGLAWELIGYFPGGPTAVTFWGLGITCELGTIGVAPWEGIPTLTAFTGIGWTIRGFTQPVQ